MVEDAERQVAEREAAELGSLAGSPEQRERLEIARASARPSVRFSFWLSAISGREVDGSSRSRVRGVESVVLLATGYLPIDLSSRRNGRTVWSYARDHDGDRCPS